MRFGLRNPSFVYPGASGNLWPDTRRRARQAEADGFHSFWVMDHFAQTPRYGPADEPFLDAWTVLPALAAATETIRLGVMVSPVGYRNPALLARMAASLDHISCGRLNFGIGAGGYAPEYRAYGYEFEPRASVRLAQMREALQLILELWHSPRTTFHGRYYHVEDAVLEPKPLQKPHPPVLIGGTGPRVTLRIAAELGDACNLWGPPAAFSEQRSILQRHCADVGRNEDQIEKTTYDLAICAADEKRLQSKVERLLPAGIEPWMALVGTPSRLVDVVGHYQLAGADQLCIAFAGNDPESYRLFVEEVMPAFPSSSARTARS